MKKNILPNNLAINDLIKEAVTLLLNNNIKTARLDVLILLENILHVSRTHILLNNNLRLENKDFKLFQKYLNKRIKHIPISQIIGFSYFYGLKFLVNKNVLQPRPETELLVEELLNIVKTDSFLNTKKHINILDVGTGSGNIGIAILKNLKNCSVDMLDISKKATKIAKINAVLYTTNYNIFQSNLLKNVFRQYDIIVANLPYVPHKHKLNKDATYEPRSSIFAKNDGLFLYQKLFSQINNTSKPLYLLLESLTDSQPKLSKIAKNNGYILYKIKNTISIFKAV
jgi:release factor glutamine methyltransferase